MTSFEQCKSCSTFILSPDSVVITNHAKQCFLESIPLENRIKMEVEEDTDREKKDVACAHVMEGFQSVTFPAMNVLLVRSSTPAASPGGPPSPRPCRERRIRTVKIPTKYSQSESESEDQDIIKASRPKKQKQTTSEPMVQACHIVCELCPARFCSKFEHKRHMDVHNGSRKLMECIVCYRIFNKRDSLNSHYAAHENAEEKEIKLNLMFSSWPTSTTKDGYARVRRICKYCLLAYTNQPSFVAHMRTCHDYDGKVSTFPCRYHKCTESFTTIATLLQHSKTLHPIFFYGKFTYNRMNGIHEPLKSRRTTAKSNKSKKRKSLHQSSDSEEDILDSLIESYAGPENIERAIELERVHILDAETNDSMQSTVVKTENENFYSNSHEVDPFLLSYALTNRFTNISTSVNGGKELSTLENDNDAVPIVLAIKSEPAM